MAAGDKVKAALLRVLNPSSDPINLKADAQSNLLSTESMRNRPTYSATFDIVPLAAGATDLVALRGSATKKVRIETVVVNGLATARTRVPVSMFLRTAANTGGTSTAPTGTRHDSTDAAATATIAAYTANPTALGAGTLIRKKYLILDPTTVDANNTPESITEFGELGKQLVLNGNSQYFAINLNTTPITGGTITVTIEWTEE